MESWELSEESSQLPTAYPSPTFPTEFSFGSSLSGSHLPSAGWERSSLGERSLGKAPERELPRSSLGEGRWEFSFGRLGWERGGCKRSSPCSHLRSP